MLKEVIPYIQVLKFFRKKVEGLLRKGSEYILKTLSNPLRCKKLYLLYLMQR